MLRLGISVSLANILIFLFTEVFIVLMGFHATRLAARYVLHRQLSSGQKIPLTNRSSIIDVLPYNSDLQPVGATPKFLFTLSRLFVIAVSVYVGATLDGEVMYDTSQFKVTSSIGVAHSSARELTDNTGTDISAVAKVSCLRLINDHRGILYKGYMAGYEVICEDGSATFTENVLLDTEIKENCTANHDGLTLKNMPILTGAKEAGANVSDSSIVYTRKMDGSTSSPEDIGTITITLLKRITNEECVFGVHRSLGGGFNEPITLEITAICNMEVIDYPRMLSTKPEFMPPGISFLLQMINGVIVSSTTKVAPRRKARSVIAVISVPGLVIAMVIAIVETGAAIGLWAALKASDVKSDFTSVKGVAQLWGEEKFGMKRSKGDDCGLFVALQDEGKKAYLGSVDGLSLEEESNDRGQSPGEESLFKSVSFGFRRKSEEDSSDGNDSSESHC